MLFSNQCCLWRREAQGKTYPAYFGTYDQFQEVRDYVDAIKNLCLVGRNGMHKYNNQDHSMLTAMTAVDNIIAGRRDMQNLWEVNTEQDYHETKEKVSRDLSSWPPLGRMESVGQRLVCG